MSATPKRELSLFDSTCIIVGIIIGAGIYRTAPDVAKGAHDGWGVMAIWVVGGLLSLCGALGYAELATAYPRAGGDYVYLSKAYGRWAGFLFAWGQLTIIRPADIAAMAFAFAQYGRAIYDPLGCPDSNLIEVIYASLGVALLTAINIVGVRQGKWTQNLLTTVKALGLLAIALVALKAPANQGTPPETFGWPPLTLALVFVLFTYGGWNEMAYVAAEVKNPRKNIVRALVLGTACVTLLYLIVNGAFLYTLGYNGLAKSGAVARDAVSTVLPGAGAKLVSALVCISALGAVNGLIFTGSRISYALGSEHRAFGLLGRWDQRTATPIYSLLAQGIIALTIILTLGSFINTLLYASVAVYSFYLATSLSVIVLRFKEPQVERPYRMTGYPVTTLIFCAVCGLLIYSCVVYALSDKLRRISFLVLAGMVVLGLLIYWLTDIRRPAPAAQTSPTDPQNFA
ncbi:MAG: amino acid permease [Phycisphaerae bacterium]|nr:amino acid permease [Phycisphaerae bacterium]